MKIIKRSLIVLLILGAVAWAWAFISVNYVQHQYAAVSPQQLAAAKAYSKGKITPVPKQFEWSIFQTNAGVTLRTGLLKHPQAKATVVVVPGFTGSIEMIMREITTIHAAGFTVATVEYRGQGLSHRPLSQHPEKGYVEDYALLADELAQYVNSVRRKESPLLFFSISKGAHITMRMAAEYLQDADGFALIVPMIHVKTGGASNSNLNMASGLVTGLGLGAAYVPGSQAWPGEGLVFGEATDCNANPDTAQTQSAVFAVNEKLRARGITYKWLYETTRSTEKLLNPEYVRGITQPVKIYTAGIEALVNTEKAEQFCESLVDCKAEHYPQARHCITREDFARYDGIMADAIAHFNQLLR